jgi:ribonuclease HII
MKRTYGADEAGRGPILGPMVIAVVGLDRRSAISLSRRGVTDSKFFGAGVDARLRRAELARVIRERAIAYRIRVVEVEEVDWHTFRGQLNVLERKVVLDLLGELEVGLDERIICDGEVLFSPLRSRFPNLQAVNGGESVHVAVAAASILAKDARDHAFAIIAAQYEAEFGTVTGGGYLNAGTRRFLEAYAIRHGGLPPEARKSWGAAKLEESLPLFDETCSEDLES